MTADPTAHLVRPATADDLETVVDAITTAFFDDPLWGPVFPDRDRRAAQAAVFWRVFATSALRYPWTLVTAKAEAVAVWIPPGGVELTDAEVDGLPGLLTDVAGPDVAAAIMVLFEQFEAVHPSEPHYYLSLLATHSDHRGGGLGMTLLRENLARIDALGLPSYLESCNPANDNRYRSVGFVPRDRFATASGHVVTTMWRDPANQ